MEFTSLALLGIQLLSTDAAVLGLSNLHIRVHQCLIINLFTCISAHSIGSVSLENTCLTLIVYLTEASL